LIVDRFRYTLEIRMLIPTFSQITYIPSASSGIIRNRRARLGRLQTSVPLVTVRVNPPFPIFIIKGSPT